MRTQSPQTITEVQKIWYRVMSLLYRSGNQSVKIPSSNELAREFGIARSTVRIALEKLTAEGFLIARRGSGTFTNPRRRLNANWEAPLIGLMMLDCNLFFYSPELQGELECFFSEFRNTGWNIRLITGQMDTPEDVREILSHSYLDGVITFGCKEFVVRTAAQMMPTVNMGIHTPGAANVTSAFSRILAELFARTGRDRNIRAWTSYPESTRNDTLLAIRSQPGVAVTYASREDCAVDDCYYEAVRNDFSAGIPDWIILHPLHLPKIREIAIGLYGEERARQSLWVFLTLPNPDPEWPGYSVRANRREEVGAAVDILQRKLNGENISQDFTVEAALVSKHS